MEDIRSTASSPESPTSVLVLAVGDLETGSTQYRVAQFAPFLARHGVGLTFVDREAIDQQTVVQAGAVDVVLNQKCLFNAGIAKRIIQVARRVIFDFDDAIFTRPGRPYRWWTRQRLRHRLRLWLRSATVVTTANQYLAAHARPEARDLRVIPMALDLDRWYPPATRPDYDPIRIGWAGSPGNVINLERLDPVLTRVLNDHPQASLHVYSGKRPALRCPHHYHPYAPGTEADFTRSLDIGLLPLPDEPHARGKSPIKAIQYLACGVAVVGNVVGATAEICTPANSIAVTTEAEWYTQLGNLIEDRSRIRQLGEAGRQHAQQHHDLAACATQLLHALKGPSA